MSPTPNPTFPPPENTSPSPPQLTPHQLQILAQQPEELFAIYDPEKPGNPFISLKPRKLVHHEGFLHKSVNAILMRRCPDDSDEILLQQRSKFKLIEPLKWDLSMAEHLQYPETYLSAVKRGLQEELGLSQQEIERDLSFHLIRKEALNYHEYNTNGEDVSNMIRDRELSELYLVLVRDGSDLSVKMDLSNAEVAQVKWVKVKDIVGPFEEKQQQTPLYDFTSWAKSEFQHLATYIHNSAP